MSRQDVRPSPPQTWPAMARRPARTSTSVDGRLPRSSLGKFVGILPYRFCSKKVYLVDCALWRRGGGGDGRRREVVVAGSEYIRSVFGESV
ncbi:unnamed protein product [Linum trigynum]|uniref:Uncharacterized protein n=1 Tax=Linum trigynum TaxID=586398 RepID=A0AAV2ESV5_9ROSI